MDLQLLREAIARGAVRVQMSQHARMEAFKEGFSVADVRFGVMAGQVIEEYPRRNRALLLAIAPETGLPIHLVLEYVEGDEWATVTTVYLPDDQFWYPGYRTRR